MADGRELHEDRGQRSHRSRDEDRSRRRSRSPHREERRSRRGEDRDRHDERGSGRYEERSSRYDDRDRERDRGDRDRDRDRDRRSSRYEDRERDGDRNRDRDRGRDRDRDRDRFARRDDTANSGGGRRRGGGGGFGGGGGGGYGGGNPADGGVFGSPNIRRSPTPEGTIPISKRPRKYTAWDVKAPGYENMSAMEAKISGSFMLPGQTRPGPAAPGGPMNGQNPNGSAPGSNGQPNAFNLNGPHPSPGHWNNQQPYPGHAPGLGGHSHHQNNMSNSFPREGGFGMSGALPPIHFKPAQGQSGPVAQTQSFARQARRLYVGNILHTANEMNVAEFFNAKMKELGLLSRGSDDVPPPLISENPVVAVQVNHEKNYAFVEFRNAEEATHGMSFDGIIFQNQALKIRRPKDYTGTEHAGTSHIPGVVSTNVPDSPNKIFIGGLPSYLTDDQVMELLKSFGELKSFNLVKDTSSGGHVSKGFAFCEYVDPDLTDIACQGLNGMELGDRYLVVQRAQIGQNLKKEKENADLNGGDRNGRNNGNHQYNTYGQAPAAAASVLAAVKGGEGEKTRVLQMLNMVNQEELVDDQEYEEILEDIKDECSKYGTIEDVKIPRPIKNEKGRMDTKASESVEGLGKVFIRFERIEDCTSALTAIAGRQFAGRVIICAYAPEEVMYAPKPAEEQPVGDPADEQQQTKEEITEQS